MFGFIKKWWEKKQQENQEKRQIKNLEIAIGKQKKRKYDSWCHRYAVVTSAMWRGTYIHWRAGKYLNDKKGLFRGSSKIQSKYWQSMTDRRRRIAENAEIEYLIEKSAPKLEQYKREGLIGRNK